MYLPETRAVSDLPVSIAVAVPATSGCCAKPYLPLMLIVDCLDLTPLPVSPISHSRFLREARSIPQLALLGPRAALCPRLPVFSFLVLTPSGGFLHHNFVAALLNDLFGVQTRGGCACAGPYAQDLLGIDEPLAARYEQVLVEDR